MAFLLLGLVVKQYKVPAGDHPFAPEWVQAAKRALQLLLAYSDAELVVAFLEREHVCVVKQNEEVDRGKQLPVSLRSGLEAA